MSHNESSPNRRFLPHAVQAFLWGRAGEQPGDVTEGRQGQFRSDILGSPLTTTSIDSVTIQGQVT